MYFVSSKFNESLKVEIGFVFSLVASPTNVVGLQQFDKPPILILQQI